MRDSAVGVIMVRITAATHILRNTRLVSYRRQPEVELDAYPRQGGYRSGMLE